MNKFLEQYYTNLYQIKQIVKYLIGIITFRKIRKAKIEDTESESDTEASTSSSD